jgi:uncharacterized protein YaiI (UPF0178 family)
MKIWIDADACPKVVKDIVISAAHKRAIDVIFVANKHLALPVATNLIFVQVDIAPDAADIYIRENAKKFDLVITQDILLAHALVSADIVAIDPRGRKYTEDNIGQVVATRNLMQGLRDSGEITGGPKQFGDKEKRAFAAAFDQELTKLLKKTKATEL